MDSKDLQNLKKVDKSKSKRVLLINPKKLETTFSFPHNGLGTLATILKNRGHEVLIVDYAFLYEHKNTDVTYFINMFKPDVIGISMYTPNANEVYTVLKKIRESYEKMPIMIGGPHATLYFETLIDDKTIDYIFRGEAELTIIDVVESAKREKSPKIISSDKIVDINDLPYTDFKTFYKWENIIVYPIMTSRGCPNQCSFCASFGLSRKWRSREPEDCIKELEHAKKNLPPFKVIVFDDNPTVNKERFYKFLELFNEKIKLELAIVNTRADGIDDRFLTLLKKCGVERIAIGVEHANPEVYKMINKGETLEEIEKACNLVKKHKLILCLSFVIGLPGDNLKRTRDSINFYKRVKADDVSLNHITPFRFTSARKWFDENNSRLFNEIGFEAQPLIDFECQTPVVETPEFSIKDREKAYYLFLFEIADYRLKLRKLPKIYSIARKYGLEKEFIFWFPKGIVTSLNEYTKLQKRGFNILRKHGFLYLLKRYSMQRKKDKIYRNALEVNH